MKALFRGISTSASNYSNVKQRDKSGNSVLAYGEKQQCEAPCLEKGEQPITHSVGNTITHPEEETTTIYAALEVSNRSWIQGLGDPGDASRTGLQKLSPQDVERLLEKIGRARRAVASGPVRVVLTYEAGYEGFWLARRLEGEDLEVVICDPASLEVVRKK